MKSNVHTLSKRQNIYTFIINHKAPKMGWKDKWFWVNNNLGGFGYPRSITFSNREPQPWSVSLTVAQTFRKICFSEED